MNTSPSVRSRPQGALCGDGFTLIEMITVCLIIVILAGFVLSAIQRARVQAKRTQAKVIATDLAAAIRNYHHEYEQWPCPSSAQDGNTTWSSNNDVVVNYLLPGATTPDGKVQNDRGFWSTAGVARDPYDSPLVITIIAMGTTNDVIVYSVNAP